MSLKKLIVAAILAGSIVSANVPLKSNFEVLIAKETIQRLYKELKTAPVSKVRYILSQIKVQKVIINSYN